MNAQHQQAAWALVAAALNDDEAAHYELTDALGYLSLEITALHLAETVARMLRDRHGGDKAYETVTALCAALAQQHALQQQMHASGEEPADG